MKKPAPPATAPTKHWFVRLGRLQDINKPGASRYGARTSVDVVYFLPTPSGAAPCYDLSGYSLIIPSFTPMRDVPSGDDEQRSKPWLWNHLQHPRYFGVLDLDMDLDAVAVGQAPLFLDAPAEDYAQWPGGPSKAKSNAKKHFGQRLVTPGMTFATLLQQCLPFAELYAAVRGLLDTLTVPYVAYFSGGGGFRVLLETGLAWRRVTWGQNYAAVFHTEQLKPMLRQLAPTLDDVMLDRLWAATDKNIYDGDKGTKPDLLAHFDTGVFPCPLDDDAFSTTAQPSTTVASATLNAAIRRFWQHVFRTVPRHAHLAHVPALVAPPSKPLQVRPPPSLEKHVLQQFDRVSGSDGTATHFMLQGNFTRYVRVDQVDDLYRRLLEQRARGEPLNWHEVRTPITRHCIDYDGGPPLLMPLPRADQPGQSQTVLAALQEIHHTRVLTTEAIAGRLYDVLLLTCRPRAGTTQTRAHLIWSDWPVRLAEEAGIMTVVRAGLAARWPLYNWATIIESPPRLRGLFSDTQDKTTGLMAQRPYLFSAAYDALGEELDLVGAGPSDLELLRLCSLRDTSRSLIDPRPPLRDLPQPSVSLSQRMTFKGTADLAPDKRDGVDAVLQRALCLVQEKHGKPKAHYYKSMTVFADAGWRRRLVCGLVDHEQCGPNTTHRNNHVALWLYIDEDRWELRCYKATCPQKRQAAGGWGSGVLDTSALRAAWPPSHPVGAAATTTTTTRVQTVVTTTTTVVTKTLQKRREKWDREIQQLKRADAAAKAADHGTGRKRPLESADDTREDAPRPTKRRHTEPPC